MPDMIRDPFEVKVLVLDGEPDMLVHDLEASFPKITFLPCRCYDAVAGVVAEHKPQIALTYRIGPGRYPRAELVEELEWVHAGGAGVDHLHPWDTSRVTVTNSSGTHGDMIGQYVMGAMLAFNQNIPRYNQQRQSRSWRQWKSRPLAGQTVVIAGYGRIGREIGRMCKFMGMRVVGVRTAPFEDDHADLGVGLADLRSVLPQADHIVISMPLTEETRMLFDLAMLSQAKTGAHLVNVSRGGILDEDALVAALDDGRLEHAVLDVFETEPLPAQHPLWSHHKVTLTPHVSSNVGDWKMRVLVVFKRNLTLWLEGRPLTNAVSPGRGY